MNYTRARICQCLAFQNRANRRTYATASTASSLPANPFPYPSHQNPTPHQIFHLSASATENDIKARYIDLVRIYHPDKASSVPPELAHKRFQAITTAYDVLRGKKPSLGAGDSGFGPSGVEDKSYQTTAAYRAAKRRRQELYSSGAVDDRWKDRIFIGLAFATVGVFVAQTFATRKEAMADMMMNTGRPVSYPSSRPQVDEQARRPTEDEKRLSA